MNTVRRLLCWLVLAALLIGSGVGTAALAGHAAMAEQIDCVSVSVADDEYATESTDLNCETDEDHCFDAQCAQGHAALPPSATMHRVLASAPMLMRDQSAPSTTLLPDDRPPRS